MRSPIFVVICFAFLILYSCNKETKYSNIPKIKFLGLNTSRVQAGSDSTILIRFEIEDGDGNVGFGTKNLFLSDSRFNDTLPYEIPKIPENYNPSNGIKGIIQLEYNAAFLFLRTDSAHSSLDTLHWQLYLKDQAGNMSNIIQTTELVLFK